MDNQSKSDKNVLIDRIPPQNNEAEMAVLASCLLDKEACGKAVEILRPENFYRQSHQVIFETFCKMYENNDPIDGVSVGECLNSVGKLEEIGGMFYLTEITETSPSSANIEHHAKIVLNKSITRKLINICSNISTECYNSNGTITELLQTAEQGIFELSQNRDIKNYSTLDKILHNVFEELDAIVSGGENTGIKSGFIKMDNLTGGFSKQDYIVIAGRPSMGKTAIALNMSENMGKENVKVGWMSLEMSENQLGKRLLSSGSGIDSFALRTGRINKDDWPKLSLAVGTMVEYPIFIDDSPDMNILQLRSKARRMKIERDIDILFIDYLQLLTGPKTENRNQEITQISRSIKNIAKELDITVVALSQLSRGVDYRKPPRPRLSDLRESGSIEQDADIVFFIYRPEVYDIMLDDDNNSTENVTEIICAKHRNGATGSFKLTFSKQITKFMNNYEGEFPSF